jgi:hypothetical protein
MLNAEASALASTQNTPNHSSSGMPPPRVA